MAERIQEAVEYLMEYPNIGRPGRVSGTRELVVSGTPFVVVYRDRKDNRSDTKNPSPCQKLA
jgi:plasmid stabilization system protein ParE